MKRSLVAGVLIVLSSAVVAGEPYYIVSRGIADASVITVFGYVDNKRPCITLETYMNKSMEEENNYHRFSCVDSATAMAIDCEDERNKGYNCTGNWQTRNDLLRALDLK